LKIDDLISVKGGGKMPPMPPEEWAVWVAWAEWAANALLKPKLFFFFNYFKKRFSVAFVLVIFK